MSTARCVFATLILAVTILSGCARYVIAYQEYPITKSKGEIARFPVGKNDDEARAAIATCKRYASMNDMDCRWHEDEITCKHDSLTKTFTPSYCVYKGVRIEK